MRLLLDMWGLTGSGRWRSWSQRRSRAGLLFFFAFMFTSTFALSLFALTSAFIRGFTLALTFGNVWIWRIKVPNISGEGGASCCHWGGGAKRSSAWGTNWFNSRLGFPRGMTDGNEFGKKGIRIPPRGATARRGVRDVRSGRNVVNN